MPKILFYCHHLYYLPQFIPVARAIGDGFDIIFAISSKATSTEVALIKSEIERDGWRLESEENLMGGDSQLDVLIMGQSRDAERLAGSDTLVVLLFHGIGIKRIYYTDTSPRVDLRFVESEFRQDQCLAVSPDTETLAVGFAKLDPLLGDTIPVDESLPNGPGAKLLYAPTFYPGSIEILAQHIPIWPSDWQIVIKPHQFTYTNPYYYYQVKLLRQLARESSNVTVLPLEAYNIITGYNWADVLVSEASSTIIEFTALDKPVVVCDELHLRWHHRLQRARFFRRRMDMDLMARLDYALHAVEGSDVADQITQALENPDELSEKRRAARDLLLGPVDGGAARRIARVLIEKVGNVSR